MHAWYSTHAYGIYNACMISHSTDRSSANFCTQKISKKMSAYYNFYYNSLQTDLLVHVAFWWVGVILLNVNPTIVSARTICPLYPCMASTGGYMICPSSGSTQLNPPCNCCYASKGCTIYYASGTSMCTAT